MTFRSLPPTASHLNPREQQLLTELADLCGVATWYTGQDGTRMTVPSSTVIFTLQELGVPLPEQPTEDALSSALTTMHARRHEAIIDPTITAIAHTQRDLHVYCYDGDSVSVWIELEKPQEEGQETTPTPPATSPITCTQVDAWVPPITIGSTTYGTATFTIPALPAGWHTLYARTTGAKGTRKATATLLVSPARISAAARFTEHPATGIMAQLYSLRDTHSWGIGDYHTLCTLGQSLEKLGGADFILVNPMHAAEATPPMEASPYLPTTRRYTNPLYIHIEDTPEYHTHPHLWPRIAQIKEPLAAANTTAQELDRNTVMMRKIEALYLLWDAGIGAEREAAVRTFRLTEGEGLEGFIHWCQETAQNYGAEHGLNLSTDFYAWLQLLCQEQEQAAQQQLRTHMRIGLMADLAVGVHPGGADARTLEPVLAPGASVGAPPDGYNQHGQDWSQPPWHPWKLAKAGYAPWRDMLRTILRSSGGIRIDHVLGLFRLWWIPRMHSPTTGTYVYYDHEALIGALVLEAERAGAVVIGEDLGTFDPWVQDYLASRSVMGTSVMWFESEGGHARAPERYRQLALTSITTHDLPPTASYLRGGHIQLREQLGVLTTDPDVEYTNDARWQEDVLASLGYHGAFNGLDCADYFGEGGAIHGECRNPRDGRNQRPGGADGLSTSNGTGTLRSTGIIEGMHRFLSMTPSALKCVALVDMVGDLRTQNQPGTTQDLYPNWCIPLCDHEGKPIVAEDLPSIALARDVLDAARGECGT